MDAILVPGGFGKRGIEGKIAAVRYARENKVPYLGICLGMQIAVIEFARNLCGLEGANSTEFDPDTPHPVVALITEWQDRDGKVERRDAGSNLGGTMRLGAQPCDVKKGVARAPDLRRRRGVRAPSPPLRGERPVRGAAGGGRSRVSARTQNGEPGGDGRARPTTPGSSAASTTRNSPRRPRTGHPLFISYVKAALEQRRKRVPEPGLKVVGGGDASVLVPRTRAATGN